MQNMKDAAAEFLANKRVAATGVSRKTETHGAMPSTSRAPEGLPGSSPSTRTPTRSRVILATTI